MMATNPQVIISPSFAPAWFLLGNVLIESGCCVIPFYSPHQRHFFLRAYGTSDDQVVSTTSRLVTNGTVICRLLQESHATRPNVDHRTERTGSRPSRTIAVVERWR